MFSFTRLKASSATPPSELNDAKSQNTQTSTSVVNNLARGLLASSPGQASVGRYVDVQFGMGKRPSPVQSNWLALRKMSRHMEVIEQQAEKANRPVSPRDRKLAAHRSVINLFGLINKLGVEEKMHPSFRKELIEHMENIIRWYPIAPDVWALAYRCILPGEQLRYQNRVFDREGCRTMYYACLERAKGKLAR